MLDYYHSILHLNFFNLLRSYISFLRNEVNQPAWRKPNDSGKSPDNDLQILVKSQPCIVMFIFWPHYNLRVNIERPRTNLKARPKHEMVAYPIDDFYSSVSRYDKPVRDVPIARYVVYKHGVTS
jgi:hypothetical protein